MKIDDFDQDVNPVTPTARRVDPTLLGRAILTFALAAMLIVALRWALNVTNANAQQVSSSLTNLQDNFDRSRSEVYAGPTRSGGKEMQETSSASAGPALEPAGNSAPRAARGQ